MVNYFSMIAVSMGGHPPLGCPFRGFSATRFQEKDKIGVLGAMAERLNAAVSPAKGGSAFGGKTNNRKS